MGEGASMNHQHLAKESQGRFAPLYLWERFEQDRDAVLLECWDALSEQTKRRIDERRWLEERK